MRRTKHPSLVPPARPPEEAPPAPISLFVEPDNPIELLGEMLHDVATMGELLRGLPFERQHYRANLRLVYAASNRMRKRCERLLEEAEELAATASPGETFRMTVPITHPDGETERIPLSGTPEELAEANRIMEAIGNGPNILKDPPAAEPAHPPEHEPVRPARKSGSTRKHGAFSKSVATSPKKPGGYTLVESFVMSELNQRGTATTTELVSAVSEQRRIPRVEVEDALADLRVAKVVETTKLGRGIINRLAS